MSAKLPSLLEQGHPFRQWKTWVIPETQLTITGYSRSNDKTFFHLPALKCCLDAGLCEGRQSDHVLLTHTHNDHSADLEFLASKASGVDLYAPEATTPYIESYIRAKRELNHIAGFDPTLANELRLHGLNGGDSFSLGKKGQYTVKVVECEHKVPCVGYCFSETKRRLKPEFAVLRKEMEQAGDRSGFGKLMGQKRKEGIEVQETFEQPLFAFLGDTHVRVFEKNPWLFDYPVIITECTFLDDKEAERAEQNGHTLWSQLRPVIEAHPEHTFVLTHFSLRHSDRDVVAFFADLAETDTTLNFDRIVLWAHTEGLLPEQHQSRG